MLQLPSGGQRKRFDFEPSFAVSLATERLIEARKRESLWVPAMAQE